MSCKYEGVEKMSQTLQSQVTSQDKLYEAVM
jgi:hypothetical protein